jgi:predicted choloylglycine hydrolase
MKLLRPIAIAALLVLIANSTFGCFILFYTDGNNMLVANHEDWFADDSAVRFRAQTLSRFASITFTFASEQTPQGGMNEKGLFFDATYTPYQTLIKQKKIKPHFNIWQHVLDKASTVEEALSLLDKFELNDLEEATIFLADRSGAAVIVGLHDHKIDVRRANSGHLLQTNFNQWHPELSEEKVCTRFVTATRMIEQQPPVTIETMTRILEQTHQEKMSVYSNIYDLKNMRIVTYNKRNFAKPIIISFPEDARYGECLIDLDSIDQDSTLIEKYTHNFSPVTVRGRVVGKEKLPVPYANIGIAGKNIGTLSDPDGKFEITIPASSLSDTLFFSALAHEQRGIILSRKLEESTIEVLLEKQPIVLEEVSVVGKKIKTKVGRLGWMGGKDGILPLDTAQGGGAVALLVEAPSIPIHLESLQVRLMYNSKDTANFRFHVYAYDSITGVPGEELLSEEIMLLETKRFGWMRFDLSRYDIRLNNKRFFIAFEWIDKMAMRKQMMESLREFERWKKLEFKKGNIRIVELTDPDGNKTGGMKYKGNMMDWPGFKQMPPFTGLMVETGKNDETYQLRTFERKTSFGDWVELDNTLNAVVTISY